MISELYQKVLENELGRARYLLLLMIVGTWQILKQAKLEIWLFVTCYGSIGGHKSTKSLYGKRLN